MKDWFIGAIKDLSLMDALELFGPGGIACSVIGGSCYFWWRYKNRYTRYRIELLKKINLTFHTYQKCSGMMKDEMSRTNHRKEITECIHEIENGVFEIYYTYDDYSEALNEYTGFVANLYSKWQNFSSNKWIDFCDRRYGAEFIDGERNWNALDMSKVNVIYQETNNSIKSLRDAVRKSVPIKYWGGYSEEETT